MISLIFILQVDFAREVEGLEQEIRDLRRKIDVNDGDEGRFSRDDIQGKIIYHEKNI